MFHLEGHLAPVSCLAFSPDGKVLASGDDSGLLHLWELKRRRLLESLHLPGVRKGFLAERMTSVVFSADGKFLLTTTHVYPPFVRVWRASDLTLLHEWEGGFSADC